MNSDGPGYVLGAGTGESRWFLDTRMTVKAGGAQTGGALTVIEWSAPVRFGPPRHVHHSEDEMFTDPREPRRASHVSSTPRAALVTAWPKRAASI
jgi:hypothetical protein